MKLKSLKSNNNKSTNGKRYIFLKVLVLILLPLVDINTYMQKVTQISFVSGKTKEL